MEPDYAPNYEAERALCVQKNSLSERWRLHSEVSWEVARKSRSGRAARTAGASSLFGWPAALLAGDLNGQRAAIGRQGD